MVHASVPHNILRRIVLSGCARKYEQNKKRCHQGIIFRNRGFCREERVIYDILHNKDMENLKRDRKNLKNMVVDFKKVIRNFGRENGNFVLKKVIQ